MKQNKSLAVKWYEKVAEQGHDYAQCSLGIYYEFGIGVRKNTKIAYQWYKKSADQGNEYGKKQIKELQKYL